MEYYLYFYLLLYLFNLNGGFIDKLDLLKEYFWVVNFLVEIFVN